MGLITYYQLATDEGNVENESVDIDKSYPELSQGLDALGLDGNYIVVGFDEDDDNDDRDEDYKRQLTSEEAEENWQDLDPVTFKQFLEAYKQTEHGKATSDSNIDAYLEIHFTTLKKIYKMAVDKGMGLKITAF